MKPHLKQWRQRMLFGIFAWGLLFLLIFIYFTDSNPAEPVPSSLSFLETRRLLPVQGKQRAIMGAAHEPSPPGGLDPHPPLPRAHPAGPFHAEPGDRQKWAQSHDVFEHEEFFSSQVGRKSQSAFYPEDDYFFAAGQPGWHSHTQGTLGFPSPGEPGPREGVLPAARVQKRRVKKRHRKQRRSHVLEEGDDGDRLYSSMSRAFLYRLWKGNVSSKMLNPRLQKAMKDYLTANKHGVHFHGKREARLSRAQLLCQLRSRAHVRTLDGTEAPFSMLGWRRLVPAVPLSQLHPRGLRSCAVVMSAGAILNSSLGEEIAGSFWRASGSHWQGKLGSLYGVFLTLAGDSSGDFPLLAQNESVWGHSREWDRFCTRWASIGSPQNFPSSLDSIHFPTSPSLSPCLARDTLALVLL
ncbi:Beta-galactoside alpha-2,6-sialyltransferase 2 [Saguinus oedipus]|uniref:Beta-galactoside alpha-2,6-sialyltransferase 2 n=1 Tax=Saguinus oedipus TaxID=9490 RepID=A0ABQ9U7E4_SAGOE|nr:Beta-galactoside alpha-2,6-sialyltransferase 2 [Saguinus oedipus]